MKKRSCKIADAEKLALPFCISVCLSIGLLPEALFADTSVKNTTEPDIIGEEVACFRNRAVEKPGFSEAEIILPSGETIKTVVAQTEESRRKGLSGVKPDQFGTDEAMLFHYQESAVRSMWMADTYMDLDICFLDENHKVIRIFRDLPSHAGRQEPPPIARTGEVYCRHVLEIRSDSPLAEKISKNTRLTVRYLGSSSTPDDKGAAASGIRDQRHD